MASWISYTWSVLNVLSTRRKNLQASLDWHILRSSGPLCRTFYLFKWRLWAQLEILKLYGQFEYIDELVEVLHRELCLILDDLMIHFRRLMAQGEYTYFQQIFDMELKQNPHSRRKHFLSKNLVNNGDKKNY